MSSQKPKLLDQVRAVLRTKHYAYSTEKFTCNGLCNDPRSGRLVLYHRHESTLPIGRLA